MGSLSVEHHRHDDAISQHAMKRLGRSLSPPSSPDSHDGKFFRNTAVEAEQRACGFLQDLSYKRAVRRDGSGSSITPTKIPFSIQAFPLQHPQPLTGTGPSFETHCAPHIRGTFQGNFLGETSHSGTTSRQKAAGFLTNNILEKAGLGGSGGKTKQISKL